jgi:hypothetical protein
MRQVKATVASKVGRRIAMIACVGILGVGAAACGDNSVTPQSPQTPGSTPAGAGVTTPPTTASAQSGGSGF